MGYTLGQAEKATGKRKSTIQKAIKSGRISATKNDIGQWQIEPVELHRVYPPVEANSTPSVENEREETLSELIELRVKVEILEKERERERQGLEKQIEDLQADRDQWRRQATQLLTHQQEQPRQLSFTEWLFGTSRPSKTKGRTGA